MWWWQCQKSPAMKADTTYSHNCILARTNTFEIRNTSLIIRKQRQIQPTEPVNLLAAAYVCMPTLTHYQYDSVPLSLQTSLL